jgi:hypothetical protein
MTRPSPPLVVSGYDHEVKDPACDLILAGAEQWAERISWSPSPSDA